MPHRPNGSRHRPLLDSLADGLLSMLSPDEPPRQGGRAARPIAGFDAAPRSGYGYYDLPTYRRRGIQIPELESDG